MKQVSKIIYLLALALCPEALASKYYEPYNKPTFNLSNIPLDVDQLKKLSQDLSILAARDFDASNALQLRANAKLVYLAQQLDSSNSHIKSLNQSFLENREFTKAGNEKVTSSLKSITAYIHYLDKSNSNASSLLAIMTKDALAPIFPEHAILVNHKISETRWTHIPSLSDYKNEPINSISRIVKLPNKDTDTNNSKSVSSKMDLKTTPADEAVISTSQKQADEMTAKPIEKKPLGLNIEESFFYSPVFEEKNSIEFTKTSYKLAKLKLTKLESIDGQNLKLQSNTELDSITLQISQALKNGFSNPTSIAANIVTINDGRSSQIKINKLLTGPVAITLGSGMLGETLPDATLICAETEESGKLHSSDSLWLQLPALTEIEDSYRIITGKGSEACFKQLLAMKDLGFFIRNEVIEVDNLKFGIEVATRTHQEIEAASELFQQLQKNSTERNITGMSFQEPVRLQLEKILKLNPQHLSAKMILLWGTKERPYTLDPEFSNKSLLSLFRNIENFSAKGSYFIGLNHIIAEQHIEEITSNLKKIEPFVDSKFDQTIKDLKDSISIMKTITRNAASETYSRKKVAEENLTKLKEKIKILEQNLSPKE